MATIAMATDYIYVIFSIFSKYTCSTIHMMTVLYDLDVLCRYAISILKIIIPIIGVFPHNNVMSVILTLVLRSIFLLQLPHDYQYGRSYNPKFSTIV